MRTLGLDVKYALRSNLQRPWLAALIVLTLSLGLGANAAVLAMVDALIVRPFPFPEVDRILLLSDSSRDSQTAASRWPRRTSSTGSARATGFSACRRSPGGTSTWLAATSRTGCKASACPRISSRRSACSWRSAAASFPTRRRLAVIAAPSSAMGCGTDASVATAPRRTHHHAVRRA